MDKSLILYASEEDHGRREGVCMNGCLLLLLLVVTDSLTLTTISLLLSWYYYYLVIVLLCTFVIIITAGEKYSLLLQTFVSLNAAHDLLLTSSKT